MCVYVWLMHFASKLTQHYKTVLITVNLKRNKANCFGSGNSSLVQNRQVQSGGEKRKRDWKMGGDLPRRGTS